MAKVFRQPEKAPKKFDVNKPYKWDPDDIFQFTGQQFAMIYHALSQSVTTKEGATIGQIYEAYQTLMDVFKEAVEQGVIVESPAPVQPLEIVDEKDDQKINNLFK